MPREAKPYVERGWYISPPFGQYLRLCPEADGITEAKRSLKLELGSLEAERDHMGGRLAPKLTVTELFVLFLETVQAEKDDTFRDYQRWCTEFAKEYDNRPARSITKADASDFELRMMKTTYVRGKQPPNPYKSKTVTARERAAGRTPRRSAAGSSGNGRWRCRCRLARSRRV